MLQPGGRVHANFRLPRALLRSPSGHAGGRRLSQVDAHTGCAPGGAGERVAAGAARLHNSPKKIFAYDKSSGITPPDVRGKERGRVQAVLRASKGWEDAHPGIPGKNEDTAIDVEEYA